jgi:hypothetical protein
MVEHSSGLAAWEYRAKTRTGIFPANQIMLIFADFTLPEID